MFPDPASTFALVESEKKFHQEATKRRAKIVRDLRFEVVCAAILILVGIMSIATPLWLPGRQALVPVGVVEIGIGAMYAWSAVTTSRMLLMHDLRVASMAGVFQQLREGRGRMGTEHPVRGDDSPNANE